MSRRSRFIKPWILEDDVLAGLGGCGKLALACGILVDRAPMIADREGRMLGRSRWVWRELFAWIPEISTGDVEKVLDLLHNARYIRRYEVDGQHYIQLLYFQDDQSPHKNEKDSNLPPAPDENPGETRVLPLDKVGAPSSTCTDHVSDMHETTRVHLPPVLPYSCITNDPPLAPPCGDDDGERAPPDPELVEHEGAWVHPEDLDRFGPAPSSESPDPHSRFEEFIRYARLTPGIRFLEFLGRQYPRDPELMIAEA